jgi:hypothetical protein
VKPPPIVCAVPVVLCLALLAAACGGGSPAGRVAQLGTSTSTTGSSSPSRGSTGEEALAYARCIRLHGVPRWPDPESDGTFDKSSLTPARLGVGSVQIAAAQRACKSLVPTYSAATQPHVLAQALTFSRCMRAHGATGFPDPESNGAIVIPHAMESSPAYLAALHFCVQKYGVPPPPSPGSRG